MLTIKVLLRTELKVKKKNQTNKPQNKTKKTKPTSLHNSKDILLKLQYKINAILVNIPYGNFLSNETSQPIGVITQLA